MSRINNCLNRSLSKPFIANVSNIWDILWAIQRLNTVKFTRKMVWGNASSLWYGLLHPRWDDSRTYQWMPRFDANWWQRQYYFEFWFLRKILRGLWFIIDIIQTHFWRGRTLLRHLYERSARWWIYFLVKLWTLFLHRMSDRPRYYSNCC